MTPPKPEDFMMTAGQIVDAVLNWNCFNGFSGETCGGCRAEANVIAGGPGWFCCCGHYNLQSLHCQQMPYTQPKYGPTRDFLTRAISRGIHLFTVRETEKKRLQKQQVKEAESSEILTIGDHEISLSGFHFRDDSLEVVSRWTIADGKTFVRIKTSAKFRRLYGPDAVPVYNEPGVVARWPKKEEPKGRYRWNGTKHVYEPK